MRVTALLFSGQGGQMAGMGRDLFDAFQVVRDVYHEASEAVGYSIMDLSKIDLTLTEYAQPAILTLSYACYKLLQEKEIDGTIMAGFSLGELTALTAAGVIPFAEAVKLAQLRGRLFQKAVKTENFAMSTIVGAAPRVVEATCQDVEGEVYCATYNSGEQIVIGGDIFAVIRASQLVVDRGATSTLLQEKSIPIHTKFMKPVVEPLYEAISKIPLGLPRAQVLSNKDGQPYGRDIATILSEQPMVPLRWDMIGYALTDAGVERVIELGPGKILSTTMRHMNRAAKIYELEDSASLIKLLISR